MLCSMSTNCTTTVPSATASAYRRRGVIGRGRWEENVDACGVVAELGEPWH